jgi:hypothetical protein
MLRSLIVANLSPLFYESKASPSLTEEIHGVTVIGMLQTSLPTIVFVLLFGSLFATSRRRRLGKTKGLQLVCYATAFQLILVAIASLGTLVDNAGLYPFAGVLKWSVFAYIVLGPACIFYTLTRNDEPITSGILRRPRLRKALGFTIAIGLSATSLCVGSLGALTPLLGKLRMGEPLNLQMVNVSLTANGKLYILA